MGECRQLGKPFRYVGATQVNSAWPSLQHKKIKNVSIRIGAFAILIVFSLYAFLFKAISVYIVYKFDTKNN